MKRRGDPESEDLLLQRSDEEQALDESTNPKKTSVCVLKGDGLAIFLIFACLITSLLVILLLYDRDRIERYAYAAAAFLLCVLLSQIQLKPRVITIQPFLNWEPTYDPPFGPPVPGNPIVWMEIEIGGHRIGRIEIELKAP